VINEHSHELVCLTEYQLKS